jgi:hypothetical protein
MRLLIFLLFTGFFGFGQKIIIEQETPMRNAVLDTAAGEMRLFYDDHYKTIDSRTFEMKRHDLTVLRDAEIGENPLRYLLKMIDGRTYFVKGSGGILYRLHNDTVARVDQSFDHHMDYGAAVFEHNGTLFKYGGYGYWSVRDFFVYFDPGVREWDAYGPVEASLIPEGITSSLFVKDAQNFYMFGGYSIGSSNRKDKIPNQKVWHFDFEENAWSYIGKHEPVPRGFRVPFDRKLMVIRDNEIQVIDIVNNQTKRYEHNPVSSRIHVFQHVFFFEDKFYVLMSLNGPVGLFVMDKDDFFGQLKSEDSFFKVQYEWILPVVLTLLTIAVLILIARFLWKQFRKSRKVVLLENGLRYKNKFVQFKPDSMDILRLLLSDLEVPSRKILELVEQEQYSPAHNERMKVQKIKDINLKLKTLLGVNEDLIVSMKSKRDRRIRIYRISRYYFF